MLIGFPVGKVYKILEDVSGFNMIGILIEASRFHSHWALGRKLSKSRYSFEAVAHSGVLRFAVVITKSNFRYPHSRK